MIGDNQWFSELEEQLSAVKKQKELFLTAVKKREELCWTVLAKYVALAKALAEMLEEYLPPMLMPKLRNGNVVPEEVLKCAERVIRVYNSL